ncbi:hypothetical protein NDU88_002854 [Pleurodeles waltl]|uniref:Uncharacterized protein n=1 Tax=Pleurodeles waltl TaxID=8319 RepID=A0AAV7RF61_PLEWA|nr:hypothetical protein NDU88_002854 [Pleurodeles waltl]
METSDGKETQDLHTASSLGNPACLPTADQQGSPAKVPQLPVVVPAQNANQRRSCGPVRPAEEKRVLAQAHEGEERQRGDEWQTGPCDLRCPKEEERVQARVRGSEVQHWDDGLLSLAVRRGLRRRIACWLEPAAMQGSNGVKANWALQTRGPQEEELVPAWARGSDVWHQGCGRSLPPSGHRDAACCGRGGCWCPSCRRKFARPNLQTLTEGSMETE